MQRFFLGLGLFMAVMGCLAAVIQGFSSVFALFDKSKSVTDDMLVMPFYCAYKFSINAALFIVFERVMGMKSNPASPSNVTRAADEPRSSNDSIS